MHRTAVGVLRGGVSDGYASSLRSGASVLQSLSPDAYDVRDILIDREGSWHVRGVRAEPVRALQGLDVVINALYNDGVGIEGGVAQVLRHAGVSYTGTRGATASLMLNRAWMREALRGKGIRMARAKNISHSGADVVQIAQDIFAEFGPPYVLKPVSAGNAVGARIVSTIYDLPEVLDDMFMQYDTLLVEEFIPGKNVSVGVIEAFRREPLYALPPTELIQPEGISIADVTLREKGEVSYRTPWIAGNDHKREMIDLARDVHTTLGLSHYSRSDFIVRGSHVYLIGVNALPELHETSAFNTMLEGVGATLPQFIEHIIVLART